ELPYCTTLLHRSSKRKKYYIHRLSNGNIDRGDIIQKNCPVKFYKFIPRDLEACPFVAIVCVGTHNHPPPPPEKIPADIKLNLQTLITQAIEDNNIITPHYIQSSNLIQAYFKSETLSEIHQSLNS
ncbi:640_t:CDS:2, partial [Racocetra persica]